MSGEKAIFTTLCIPGGNYPYHQKNIVAKVTDGKETKYFTFGPHCTQRQIMEMIPRLWMDFHFKRRGKSA
ncbi:hypothetical protein BABA_17362 [Neobacillus bataviensis LMG 21833]|jgi:hypothetical protein|uniref:Uncharacterized protein n=1 Tax=Neobacillus bataviensis LMG 21833 TaxID=1117379 RepID=K6DCN4_9BACI|nr:hypothetical protein [Neobacillus bataviensis]EKN66034.1 hypothetical protein BABA_17362 [Neobacillus bataviensis LMG 21833]